MMRLIPALSAVALSASALSACSTPSPAPQGCMDGRARALTEGDFSGPILCDDADASFVLAGRTGDYAIYDYRYRYHRQGGGVPHGGQRILVFRDQVYLGQYGVSPPPYVTVSVHDPEIRFASPDGAASSPLNLTHGPPPRAFIGGYEALFFR